MNLLRDVTDYAPFSAGVVASVGNFDGVHLGHQHLIEHLKRKALDLGLPLVVVLFEPQPREFFQKSEAPARLSTLREKIDALRDCGIDYVYCIRFNKRLAQTAACDFVRQYLFHALKAKYLLVGDDFRFGKNREGDVTLLHTLGADYGCEVSTYADFCIEGLRVSSTHIRQALQQGNITKAAQFLGRPYSLCGRVIRGDGRGRQWGIPTANLALRRAALPLLGVFAVRVRIGSQMVCGVANIGCRPTVDGSKYVLEIHLLDFNESVYGQLVHVFFLHKIRDEVKFTSVDALIAQIHQDILATRAFLGLNPVTMLSDIT